MDPVTPIKVVDFSNHLSGPMAAHLLVEIGADVLKVEHPKIGDGNRGNEPLIAGAGDLHVGLNAGARSIAVSTHSPHWPTVVAACASWADAVIVGARPSDAARRGLDFASLQKANPEIVYCLISGYGLVGPWADYKAHGQNMDALAGRVDLEWVDGKPETQLGWRSAGTSLAGVFGALGALAGVIRRDRGGGAQFVHTSIWNTAMWWNWRDINTLANLGHGWNEYQSLGARYGMYRTSDDRALLVCPLEQKFWEAFCDVAELPAEYRGRGDWTHSMDFGSDDEIPVIAARIATKSLDDWTNILHEAEVPFAPVLTLEEALDSDHAKINQVVRGTTVNDSAVKVAASPVQFHDDEQGAMNPDLADLSSPPDIGEHTAGILDDIGLSELIGEDLAARSPD
jgi:crotonobetainyl-CoA:carnitine CoA-transferase CaiB-like acyl-CoA transferase